MSGGEWRGKCDCIWIQTEKGGNKVGGNLRKQCGSMYFLHATHRRATERSESSYNLEPRGKGLPVLPWDDGRGKFVLYFDSRYFWLFKNVNVGVSVLLCKYIFVDKQKYLREVLSFGLVLANPERCPYSIPSTGCCCSFCGELDVARAALRNVYLLLWKS